MSEAGFLARFRRARPAVPPDREEPSLLPRKRATPPPASSVNVAVDQARRQARQRLIGAGVLLSLGVIAFPVVFETQPRPVVAPDLPMRLTSEPVAPASTQTRPLAQREIASRPASAQTTDMPPGSATDAEPVSEPVSEPVAGGGVMTPASTTAEAAGPAQSPSAAPTPSPSAGTAERLPDPAAKRAPVSGSATVSPAPAAGASVGSAGASPTAGAAAPSAASSTPAAPAVSAAPAARESPTAPAAAPRFIVQVGAFADAGSVRSLRARIERLGLSTYTQAVDTAAGRRIRVRMGPYESREDANRALEKLQQSGVSGGMVLTL